MNHFSKRDGSKKSSILFMMFVCILLSNVSVFGQTTIESNTAQSETTQENEIVNTTVEMSTIKQEAASTATNMNFVLWLWVLNKVPMQMLYPLEQLQKNNL